MMKFNMGCVSLVLISVIIGVQLGEVKGFKNFIVGGATTWRVPVGDDTTFFDHWAASKRFHVGDSLQFQYVNDSVVIVDKYGYYHCKAKESYGSFYDGNTIIKLERPGLTYFISDNFEHCHNGQRLVVDVMSQHSSPVASPPGSEDHGAESPAPATAAHHSGSQSSHLHQVPALLGLVATTSLLFV